MRHVPLTALLLGAAGLLPFLGCALVATMPLGEWSRLGLLGLLAYAAVILAFLGGVHWGFALPPEPAQTPEARRARLTLGVLPSLIGWIGLVVTFIGLPLIGLLVMILGFAATTLTESRARRAGLMPPGYMGLRWVLSVIVIACLVAVLLVLAMGGHLVL